MSRGVARFLCTRFLFTRPIENGVSAWMCVKQHISVLLTLIPSQKGDCLAKSTGDNIDRTLCVCVCVCVCPYCRRCIEMAGDVQSHCTLSRLNSCLWFLVDEACMQTTCKQTELTIISSNVLTGSLRNCSAASNSLLSWEFNSHSAKMLWYSTLTQP